MEVVKLTQNKELVIQAKLFGVTSNHSRHLPSWMKSGDPFVLKANCNQANDMVFDLYFNDDPDDMNCHSKVNSYIFSRD